MNFQSIIPDKSVSLFVKNIWVFESEEKDAKTSLPFFADGFPGLMFQQTENGLIVKPHDRKMPEIFLYGQTINPIVIEISGTYLIIIFQLYPFVLRTFFDVLPQSINDNCYYLDNTDGEISKLNLQLISCKTLNEKIDLISNLLLHYFENKKQNLDLEIRKIIVEIMAAKGQENIRAIAEKQNLNLRTFERRFLKETGLPPKQFAKIIQFQASLKQLSIKDYTKMTDIVYENGFADQSHFIKVFKAFTGKTPKNFSR
ncbi:helix-turn-helix domain-containing protein [Pedobacter frigoris]|uniref:AraC family transcriptional regulator n=1 Tax=Pedobacter frigoris TaxID=2571272 RepID=A0A4U1CFD4_9SPHI|nr:helix-turn-helix domain-containing protein [Pedobacter frigoris]TKC05852.1 AraC family transcriptional regulator [Pedobacter frigoris]